MVSPEEGERKRRDEKGRETEGKRGKGKKEKKDVALKIVQNFFYLDFLYSSTKSTDTTITPLKWF